MSPPWHEDGHGGRVVAMSQAHPHSAQQSFAAQLLDELESIRWGQLAGLTTAQVDALHEIWRAYAVESFPAEYADRPAPKEATALVPGSTAKIELMRARVAASCSAFHPDDSPDWAAVGMDCDVNRNGRVSIAGFRALANAIKHGVPEKERKAA